MCMHDRRTLLFFIISLVFIVGMVLVVAKQTNVVNFAYSPEQMQRYCARMNISADRCEALINKRLGKTGNTATDSWCSSACKGSDVERTICTRVCTAVNSGKTCESACRQFGNPAVSKACTKRCPALIMPTPTVTPIPIP